AVTKEGVEIARVTEPGAVFGEISALLDQPHTADVHALTSSEFHVADAAALLQDPAVLLYVAAILAGRLDGANKTLVELMIQVDHPRKMIEKTAKKMKGLLGASGVRLPYAGTGCLTKIPTMICVGIRLAGGCTWTYEAIFMDT